MGKKIACRSDKFTQVQCNALASWAPHIDSVWNVPMLNESHIITTVGQLDDFWLWQMLSQPPPEEQFRKG